MPNKSVLANGMISCTGYLQAGCLNRTGRGGEEACQRPGRGDPPRIQAHQGFLVSLLPNCRCYYCFLENIYKNVNQSSNADKQFPLPQC